MKIEKFAIKSEGEWCSMRSGHSLVFQQFEQVVSNVSIKLIDINSPEVESLIKSKIKGELKPICPFRVDWEAESDWEQENSSGVASGSCLLIPFPTSSTEGMMLRSVGYTEEIETVSRYEFLSDGTFILTTKYNQSTTEERIWFLSENLRCRSSVIKTAKGTGILQTSYSSEIRRLKD